MTERFDDVIARVKLAVNELKQRESEFEERAVSSKRNCRDEVDNDDDDDEDDDDYDGKRKKKKKRQKVDQYYEELLEELTNYLRRVPVIGFNSQNYDINVMKGPLLRLLQELDDEDFGFVVKKVNKMTCIDTSRFRFLDIANFIAPGYSYAKYLKAFKCTQAKGFFPYEWMDSIEKLNRTSLPERESFYSSLKDEHLSEEDYAYCQRVWRDEGMQTMRDFLVWYNNLDVVPFVEAVKRQRSIYREKGIDMLKEAISLPGLAVRWMFKVAPQPSSKDPLTFSPFVEDEFGNDVLDPGSLAELYNDLRRNLPIMLINETDKDLYQTVKNNLVGGPSIVFHRYHEAGVTRLREREMKEGEAKLCQKILGVDANALYLWCMMQNLPTGNPRITKAENGFEQTFSGQYSKVAHGWLQYQSYKSKNGIAHAFNGGEVKLGKRRLPVDGFCEETNTVYQFHGCYWHGHNCRKNPHGRNEIHPTKKIPVKEVYAETINNENYLCQLGYKVNRIWECEWENLVSKSPHIKAFLKIFFQSLYPKQNRLNDVESIVNAIRDGSFFGFIECDIRVPEALKDKFSEMGPVFKNVEVSRDQLSEHMLSFAKEEEFLCRPQRMLVGSLFGEKVLLLSELARWYLEHGLEITRIYQLVRYEPRQAFSEFGKFVSDARRRGDLDPDLELLATTNKLVGNSSYGKTITDKEKHRNVKYVQGDEVASQKVRSVKFISLEEIDNEFYEIITHKRKVRKARDSFQNQNVASLLNNAHFALYAY